MEQIFQTLEVPDISDHYQIVKKLGCGSFGKVLLAQEKKMGESVAIKLLRKDRTKRTDFLKELSISISLSRYHHVISTYPIFINTMDYYVMTQELATAGTLHGLITEQGGLPENAVKRCALQLSRALDYMHGRRLVHLDLKPDNVLLMDKDCFQIKLSDFGLTQNVGSLVSSMSHIIPYMSPELCDLKPEEYLILQPSVDTWALGVLLYVAATGLFPWKEAVKRNRRYRIYAKWQKSADLIPPPAYWELFTREALNMFNKLLSHNSSTRPSVLSVLNYLHFAWKIEGLEDQAKVPGGVEDLITGLVEESQKSDCVIVQDQEGKTTNAEMDPSNPVFMMIEETTLTLGSEVEIF